MTLTSSGFRMGSCQLPRRSWLGAQEGLGDSGLQPTPHPTQSASSSMEAKPWLPLYAGVVLQAHSDSDAHSSALHTTTEVPRPNKIGPGGVTTMSTWREYRMEGQSDQT